MLCLSLNVFAAKLEPLPMPIAAALPVEVALHQQELAVDVPDNSAVAMQFGLLGALIGAAVTNAQVGNAEERVADIRNLLVDYHFNQRFEQALRSKITSEGISPNPVITILQTPWDAAEAAKLVTAPQDVLVLTPRYSMASNFELMTVSLTAVYQHRELKSNGKLKLKNRFARNYIFKFPLDKLDGSGADEDAKRWIAMGGGSLQAVLEQGITQVTDMLAYDLSPIGRAEALLPVKRVSGTLKGKTYAGRLLREDPQWLWVRAGNGWMQAIHGFQPLTGEPLVASTPEAAVSAAAAPSMGVDAAASAPSADAERSN